MPCLTLDAQHPATSVSFISRLPFLFPLPQSAPWLWIGPWPETSSERCSWQHLRWVSAEMLGMDPAALCGLGPLAPVWGICLGQALAAGGGGYFCVCPCSLRREGLDPGLQNCWVQYLQGPNPTSCNMTMCLPGGWGLSLTCHQTVGRQFSPFTRRGAL